MAERKEQERKGSTDGGTLVFSFSYLRFLFLILMKIFMKKYEYFNGEKDVICIS